MASPPRLIGFSILLFTQLFPCPLIASAPPPASETQTLTVLTKGQETRAQLYTKVSGAVVGLVCNGKLPNGRASGFYGTGAVITFDGLILTNTSVIPKDSTDVKAYFTDGHVRPATIIKVDEKSEAVLIKVEAKGLTHMHLADSRRSKVGDPIYSWGNPRHTIMRDGAVSFSTGSISGLYNVSSIDFLSRYVGPVIETDAAINGGSDGGPLTDANGNLVGLVSLTVSTRRWLGVAVPVHVMIETIPELKQIELVKPNTDDASESIDGTLSETFARAGKAASAATVTLMFIREGQEKELTPPENRREEVVTPRKPYPINLMTGQILPTHVRRRPPSGIGSGFIVEPDGTVLTAAYQLAGNKKIIRIYAYLHDGSRVEASVLGKDKGLDLAVLKLKGKPGQAFPAVELFDKPTLHQGSTTAVLGRSEPPGNLTVNPGMVSGRNRFGNKFCQISSLINYGNLGGPVIDLDGRVIGMAARLDERSTWRQNCGVGFMLYAVRIKEALPFLKAGKAFVRAKTPYLGIQSDRGALDIKGVRILRVMPKSEAEKAGLKKGDIITLLNGKPVIDFEALTTQIKKVKIGQSIAIGIKRGGKQLEIKAKMGSKG